MRRIRIRRQIGWADWTDSRTRDQLESIPLAEVPREVPSNAALWSLAQPHDDESIRRLLRVISKVRHRGLRTRAERLLSHAAEPRHETPGSLADRLVPTHVYALTGHDALPAA